jgi:hypothetical protein
MARPLAVHYALDLAAMPGLARIIERDPLPDGILDLVRIAAGCTETTERAAALTGRPTDVVRQAAVVYLQTALFAPTADSYRALGVGRDARQDEIRRNLGWLMKWLHPDHAVDDWESRLAGRVLSAWEELKSPDRRARYDRLHPPAASVRSPRPRGQWRRPWLPWVQPPLPAKPKAADWGPRLVAGFVIGLAALTVAVAVDWWGGDGQARYDDAIEGAAAVMPAGRGIAVEVPAVPRR